MLCKNDVRLLCILGSAVSVLALHSVKAEESTEDRIVVKGSRLDQVLTETGSSVSIITAEEIDRLGIDFAQDAIALAPGITVNSNGAFGGAASVRIRGAGSEQTLVLIDGVPVNDTTSPGGGFDFGRLDTENIDRIEILKGPQSTLWGTDAIGGVVSITTKVPQSGLGGTAFAEYGSYETYRGGVSVEGAGERADFRLAATGTSSDGISKADEDNGNSEEDPYEALTLSAKGGLNLGGGTRLSADILWTDADTEFDGFSSGAQGNVGDSEELSSTEELSANISLSGNIFDGVLKNNLLLGYSDIERENFTAGVPGFAVKGDRVIYRYQGTVTPNARHKFSFGLEREETQANDNETSLDGLFALYEFKPTETLTLTGGVRRDDHERFGGETTARLAVAYNPHEQLTLRASWGQGFKAPTIFQTTFFCCGATEPNQNLQAETSEAYDIGADWRSGDESTTLGLTIFQLNTENQIDFSFALGAYENIAQVESKGAELYVTHQLAEWLGVSAEYTYLDATDGRGVQLARLPEHSGNLLATLAPSGPVSASLLFRYNGEELNTDGSSLDAWTRLDLSAQYEVNDSVELFGRIENLTDADYQQVLGYGTPDRSAYIGIRLRY